MSVGSLDDALSASAALQAEFANDEKTVTDAEGGGEKSEVKPSDDEARAEAGRLVQEEEVQSGAVSWASCASPPSM